MKPKQPYYRSSSIESETQKMTAKGVGKKYPLLTKGGRLSPFLVKTLVIKMDFTKKMKTAFNLKPKQPFFCLLKVL
jgi:hypothetical protein